MNSATVYDVPGRYAVADIDGCAAAPCVVGSTCVDAAAPGGGHTCTCDDGYFGADDVDGDGSGCTACTPVENAASVACTAADDSRAICTAGYGAVTPDTGSDTCVDIDGCATDPCTATISACVDTAAPGTGHVCQCSSGYFGDDGQDGDGSACTACDAVVNSESVTCTAAGDSRAVCSAGFVHTDNSQGGVSDTCDPPTCASTDACSPCPGGTFPTEGSNCPNGDPPAACSMVGTTFEARRGSCELTAGCTYVGHAGGAHPTAVCTANTEHIIDNPDSVTCVTFPCTQTECCADNVCTCSNGVPGTVSNFMCEEHNTNQCASCDMGYYRDGNFDCQPCTAVPNAWPEGASISCTAGANSELQDCDGAGQQPCCADGFYLVRRGTAGNTADECHACVEDVTDAYPVATCVPASAAERDACAAAASETACNLLGACEYTGGACQAVATASDETCSGAATGSTVLEQQSSCRAEAGCMYRATYRCASSADSVAHGCAPGFSPGGDVGTAYDTDGYTSTCVACAPGLFGNDGTCAECSPVVGSQTESCKPGGPVPASIAVCAAIILTTPSSLTATAGPTSNQGRCEAIVGIPYVPEVCEPFDCSLGLGTSGYGTTGYVPGTISQPSTTCGFYCTLTVATATTPERCTPLVEDCSIDQNGDPYVPGTPLLPTTTCYGNRANQGGAGETTCLNPNTGTQQPCKCQFAPAEAMIPACEHETFSTLPANAGATACTTCPAGQQNADAATGACTDCQAGQYQPSAGQAACINCPLGSLTGTDVDAIGEAGAEQTDAYEGAGQPGGVRCDVCAAGTATDTPAASASACDACQPGSASDPADAACYFATDETRLSECAALTSQAECAANAHCRYIIPGSQCRACMSGQYQDQPQQAACILCNPGSYTDTLLNGGASACIACSPGQFTTDSTTPCAVCDPGSQVQTLGVPTADNAGGDSCDSCEAGTYSTASTIPCADCAAGTYSTGGATTCIDCEIGRYQPNAGIGDCLECGDGSQTDVLTGAATSCTSCAPGQYSTHTVDGSGTVTESMACDDCGQGSVSTGGAAACTLCLPGLYMPSVGQTLCEVCIAGSVTIDSSGAHTAAPGAVDCIECAVGEYSTDAITDCAVCIPGHVTYQQGVFHVSTGSDDCVACTAGRFSVDATTDCTDCGAGFQTADSTGAFVASGATACDECFADAASQSLAAQVRESCTADVTTPLPSLDTIALCEALTIADQASCEDPAAGGNALCVYTAAAPVGARGYADLDGLSSTECHACPPGTMATAAGQLQCVDFDECASNPCGNGATCMDTIMSGIGGDNTAPYYSCTCAHGFAGYRCQFLDECALDPCHLSTTTSPGIGSYSETSDRFVCPVNIVCVDPDNSVTDDYTCTCPACDSDVALSASTATLLSAYFRTHPAVSRFVARSVRELNRVDDRTCVNPAAPGCTDAAAVNYDPTAGTDDGSCEAKVYGCMDKRALNYNPAATAYDATGTQGELCEGKFCSSLAECVSIFAHHDVCKALGEYASCPGDVCNPIGQLCTDTAGQLPAPDIQASCDAADISSPDLFTATSNCEAQSADTYSGYPTVCRYHPVQHELCPATVDDTHGAEHDGTCACPAGTTEQVLGASAAQVDECAPTNYNGVDEPACSAAAHRLCSQFEPEPHAHDVHEGFPGRACTAFRDAFACPDGAANDNQFDCVDPNPYWLGDYTCSCAVEGTPPRTCTAKDAAVVTCAQPADGDTVCPDNVDDCVFTADPGGGTQGSCALTDQAACTAALGITVDGVACHALKCTYAVDLQYDSRTISYCGTQEILTDTTTTPPTTVTNYLMTLLLEASSTVRSHVCTLIGSPLDCVRHAL